MSNNQFAEESTQDQVDSTYFKLGLKYLVSGVHQCLNVMQGCDQASEDGNQKLFSMAKDLKERIDIFCSSHLKNQNQAAGGQSKTKSEADQLPVNKEELKQTKESNRRLRRANFRLKKRIRHLRANLTQIKKGISHYLELEQEKREEEKQSLPSDTSIADQQTASITPNQDNQSQIKPHSSKQNQNTKKKKRNNIELSKPPQKVACKAIQASPREKQAEGQKTHDPVLRNLSSKVDDLHQSYLKSTEKRIQEMKIQTKIIKSHQEEGMIGASWTLLAIKNHNSYMIGSKGKGAKLVENNTEIYSGKLPVEDKWLQDIIYVTHLNSYLIYHNDRLYKKDIDNKPIYLFLELKCGLRVGACLKYSKLNKRVIIAKDYYNVSALHVESKKVQVEIIKTIGDRIRDMKLFGDNEDRVVTVTKDGYVILYKFNFRRKTGWLVNNLNLHLVEETEEEGVSIAVCSRNRHVLVELMKKTVNICSRIIALELKNENLVLKTVLDRLTEKIPVSLALENYAYIGNHALLISLCKKKDGFVQVYDYNTESGELRELEWKREVHQELDMVKIVKLGNEFYYSGFYGNVAKLTIQI